MNDAMKRPTITATLSGIALGAVVGVAAMRLPAGPMATQAPVAQVQYYPPGPIGAPGQFTLIPGPLDVRPVLLDSTGAVPTAARGRLPPWEISQIPGR